MFKFPIGVMTDSFRVPFPEAVKKAAAVGAEGIQVYTTTGEMSVENLTPDKRKEVLKIVKDNGLKISALCGDFGGHGFSVRETNAGRIEVSKRIVDLALDLETNIVTTHIGVVPNDKNHERYKIMQEACFELSRYADEMKAHFAVETGPETSAVLKGFLDALGSRGVGVNLDPANLVMVTGDDPVGAVYNLKDYIVHTHAKDGIKLLDRDPEIIYGVIKHGDMEGDAFREVPLGEGSVDFPKYLAALEDIGYKGFLTIEREVGADPSADISMAVNFLKGVMGGK